uniref:DNA ligase n=1 Tax=Mastacembelus armatus TaxID=205130 RepID=A0A7N8XQV1_9TELE
VTASLRSFFQPKSKDVQRKTTDDPVKNPLKVQNGVSEADSPIKKVVKRSRQILDSDDDEAPAVKEQVATNGQVDKETPSKTGKVKAVASPVTPATPATPASSVSSGTPGTPNSISPSGIVKRKTARKMFPKRKLDESRSGSESQKEEAEVEEDQGQQNKRPRVESSASSAGTLVEKAVTETSSPDEEVENKKKEEGKKAEEEEQVGRKSSDEKEKKAEGAEKKNEAKEKTDDEKGPAVAKEEAVEKDTREGGDSPKSQTAKKQKDKEPAKKAPISSFFGGEEFALICCLFVVVLFSESTSGQTDYDPSRPGYHPVDHACWKQDLRVSVVFVSSYMLNDLLCCVYLCLNQLGPAYLGMELGVGETVLMKAVAQATGRQLDKIKAEAQEKGDLGLVAESSRSNQRMMFQPASLTAGGVFRKLKEIASMSGNSAMNKKIDIIKGLFVACRFSEARYIVRSLAGKLRIGLAEQSILSALSQAVCLTPSGQGFPPAVIDAGKGMSAESRRAWIEEKSLILKQTYCEMPNYDVLIPVLLKEGIDQLPNHCKLTPGVPLRPMLAHPTKGVSEVMKKFDEAAFTCEYKYDGERAQIHILESGEVRIFSRNQEDNTSKYPDIISRIPKVKKDSVVSCVLDSEAVAWDREKKQIQPFQVLTTRKRKDVDASEIKVQVCVYAFDLLYLNGESLVRQPLCRRRALLRESFSEVEGEFVFARSIDSDNTDTIAEFLEQSVRDSCEGLMVKTLEKDATYEIAKRSHNWLKLKKDYLEGVGDTVDLCVIGAYLGKGKRTGTYGGFLLACYDDENEEFQSVCKIGTGFKDEDLEQHYKFLKEHLLPKPRAYYRVDQSAEPDVWLDAVQVWEVKCADLSLSPIYKAAMGMVDSVKGISLRFPRFLRIRDDKKPEDATTGAQIADLYKKQQQIQNQGEKADLEDYY